MHNDTHMLIVLCDVDKCACDLWCLESCLVLKGVLVLLFVGLASGSRKSEQETGYVDSAPED